MSLPDMLASASLSPSRPSSTGYAELSADLPDLVASTESAESSPASPKSASPSSPLSRPFTGSWADFAEGYDGENFIGDLTWMLEEEQDGREPTTGTCPRQRDF